MKKSIISILMALLLVLSIAPVTAFAESAGNVPIDTLTVTIGLEPDSIDPAMTADGSNYILHMFEGLTTIDQNGVMVPGIAESWDISEGGTVYTFHLRDAKWSDGNTVSANDFVFAWQRVDLPIQSVQALDDKTLQVTLEAPCGYFLTLVGQAAYMPVRSDVVTESDAWTQNADTYISNGPYMLESWDHGSQIVMVKNPYYWNISNIIGPNKIVWKLMDDADAIHTAYVANDLQYAGGVSANLYNSEELEEFPSLITNSLYFNPLREQIDDTRVLNDVRIRQAISLVIDRNYIVGMVGGSDPANNFVPRGIIQPDGTDFNQEATPAFNIDANEYENNVAKAQALLAAAGYPNGEGFPLLKYLTFDRADLVSVAEYIKQVLTDKLGISMYIYKTDIDTFWGELEDGNYDITRMSWVGGGDPYDFLQPFDSDFPYNNTGYSNTDYDNLLDQSNTETNRTVRFQLLQQAQELVINRDFAVCPIYYRTQLAAVKPYLSGIANYNAFTFFFWTVQQGYNFTGFFQPVDMNGVINAVKAGSSIPIKFSLGGDMGLDIMDMGYPKALDFNPGLGSTTDAIETATAGNSGLTYDSVTNQYTYVWKTDKSWAGLCKVFVIRFNDGTESCAYFKFS